MQLGLCAAALVSARVAVASDLDPHTGALRSTAPSAIMIGFENPTQIATLGVALTKIQRGGSGFGSTLVFVDGSGSAMTADDLAAHEAPDPAVEGSHALLLGTGPADGASGILVPWSKLSPLVSTQKIQVTVWVRSNGATPLLVATYGRGTLPVAGTFTSVTAIPTGRETSDRWAELSTGPIDTAIWGVPLAQITVGLSSSDSRRSSSATLVVDALEIVPIAGTPLPPNPCTMATQDAACGPDGECQFGHCLPAYASWGPTPPAEHRADFVERWISLAKQVHGARNATANAGAMVAARPSLTAAQVGGRQFYAGMIGLVNGLRNHHTNFGSPANGGLLQPIMAGVSSSTLGACAGFGELDLLEDPEHRTQMLGFLIYEVAPTSVVGATLKVGDAITAIDGIDPLTWVRSVYLTYATGVPSDPGADLAWAAASVAWMISHRASTLEVTRCASATECTGSNRSVLQIDVAGPAWRNLQGTGLLGNEQDPNLLGCTERFRNALTNLPTSTSGSDTVTTQTIWGDVLGVQFDGTLADFAAWEGSFLAAFSANPSPTKILFDVRQGNGGYAENAELIAEAIRDPSQPIGEVGFPVAAWDGSATVPSLLAVLQGASPSCETATTTLYEAPCAFIAGFYFLGDYFAQVGYEQSLVNPSAPIQPFAPAWLGARVAWLQAADVSANDYLAALIEGRTNQRVFAPGPTSGSYGTISPTPALLLGWHGGSIQMTDSVWGPSVAALATKSFRSGTGVAPDVIIAQTMSDALNGVDTMLAAAQAWLESGTP